MDALLKGRVVKVEDFPSDYLYDAIGLCLKEHRVSTMPEIIDIKIENQLNSKLWQHLYSSASMKAIGKNRAGNRVIVYSHLRDNLFANPRGILEAIDRRLVKGAGKIPSIDFYRLVELDELKDENGNRLVWVLDYDNRRGVKKTFSIEETLEDPETIPFLGGEERAERYLQLHKEIYGERLMLNHSNEFKDENIGWLLYLGNFYIKGLFSNYPLDSSGHFLGIKEK